MKRVILLLVLLSMMSGCKNSDISVSDTEDYAAVSNEDIANASDAADLAAVADTGFSNESFTESEETEEVEKVQPATEKTVDNNTFYRFHDTEQKVSCWYIYKNENIAISCLPDSSIANPDKEE